MIKKIEGIIISTVDYKESSKIINIFTKELGIIGVLAKGCKRVKSKLSSTTSTLTYGVFYLKQYGNNLPLLMEVDVINSFKTIRKDFTKINYSLYLLELSSKVYQHDKNVNIYSLLIEGLNKINENLDERVVVNILELKYLEYLGIKPHLLSCVNCGSKDNIITISSYKGGFLCKSCVGDEHIYKLKTLKLIKLFLSVEISKIKKLTISDDIKLELSLFINDYYERYSGLYLKSKSLLEKFRQEMKITSS